MICNMALFLTEVYYRYLDLTFAQTLNECGVIACVQLLHTMPSLSKEKEILNLLQRAKVLTFRFMYKMTTTGEAIAKASQDETFGENARHGTEQFVDDFTRLQLQETFRSFSEWMDENSVSSLRTVESIIEELKERTSYFHTCTEILFDSYTVVAMFSCGTNCFNPTSCLRASSSNGTN